MQLYFRCQYYPFFLVREFLLYASPLHILPLFYLFFVHRRCFDELLCVFCVLFVFREGEKGRFFDLLFVHRGVHRAFDLIIPSDVTPYGVSRGWEGQELK